MLNKIKIVGIYIQYFVLTGSIGWGLGWMSTLIANTFSFNRVFTLVPMLVIIAMYSFGIKEHFIDPLFELNNIKV